MDMTASIAPRSDQLNAEDLLTGPRTVTITAVREGSTDQPVEVVTEEFGDARPFKPSKTVRRLMVAAWGKEAADYLGHRMTLYRDATVRFGGQDVGGIRVSHMSHLDKPLSIMLTVTRGKRASHTVQPLADTPAPAPARTEPHAGIVKAFADLGVTVAQLEAKVGQSRDQWMDGDVAGLVALGRKLKAGDTTIDAEFAGEQP